MKLIKPFIDVKVGDMAFENPDAGGEWNNKQGIIKWKGTGQELLKSKYKSLASDIIDGLGGSLNDLIDDYDWVVVNDPMYGNTLFNYNGDPSGCVVFKKFTKI